MKARGCVVGSVVLFSFFMCNFAIAQTTPVSGTISTDTTWALTNSPYLVTGNITVNPGVTLTIEPGTVVKFLYRNPTLTVNGTLDARGTAGSPIIFTSERDDTHGGDSNGDLGATSPNREDWDSVVINGHAQLEYSEFWYGGYDNIRMLYINVPDTPVDVVNCSFISGYRGMEYTSGATAFSATISGNVVSNCTYGGMEFNGSGVLDLDLSGNHISGTATGYYGLEINSVAASSDIHDNDFENCGIALQISQSSPLIRNNVIKGGVYPVQHTSNSYPTYSGNTFDASIGKKVIAVNGTISSDRTWGNSTGTGYPYLITGNMTVNAGSTLTIEPGTVVKFLYRNPTLTVNGTLDARGTAGSPIIFTSERDDTHGGDSNGDLGATSPNREDWDSVVINGHAQLEYSEFWYGGYDNIRMLYINVPDTPVDVVNCSFISGYRGMEYTSGATAFSATISGNVVSNCTYGGMEFNGSGVLDLDLSGNHISGTATGYYGLEINSVAASSDIHDNDFENCGIALQISQSSPLIRNNVIKGGVYPVQHTSNSYPTYSGNTFDASIGKKVIAVNGTISSDRTWGNSTGTGYPYLITGNMTVNAGSTLTIEPGTVVKFLYRNPTLTVNGTLDARGTAGSPIIFTSERDDTHGGDSNGDLGATSPNREDWDSVVINGHAQLEYSEFWYGGYDNIRMLYINVPDTPVDVVNCSFISGYRGMEYTSGATAFSATISGNVVSNCTYGGMEFNGSGVLDLDLSGNHISGTATGYYGLEINSVAASSDIHDNDFENCGIALQISQSSPLIRNNVIKGGVYPVQHTSNSYPTYSGNTFDASIGKKVIAVNGTISSDRTWGNSTGTGYPYLITGNMTVNAGSTLTIEPGTVVKFLYRNPTLTVNGTLDARGTAGSPIIFTSERDDTHGGDSNGDLGATSPNREDWDSVVINGHAQLEYSEFWYGGYDNIRMLYINVPDTPVDVVNCSFISGYRGMEYTSGATAFSATISGNVVSNCTYGGMEFNGSGVLDLDLSGNHISGTATGYYGLEINSVAASSDIHDNDFENCGIALQISQSSPLIRNNVIKGGVYPVQHTSNSYPTYSGNTFDASIGKKVIAVNGTISSDRTWGNSTGTGYPYLITGNMTVNAGSTLTIEPGTVVKFLYRNPTLTVNGTLDARGTAGSPIVFTSERDDTHGGDSNGDLGATSPNREDWDRVIINGQAQLEYSEFWYGGYDNTYMLYITSGSSEIRRCSFVHGYYGIYINSSEYDSRDIIADCTFDDVITGIRFYGSTSGNSVAKISGNSFEDSTTGVLISRIGGSVDAYGNEFESISGYAIQNSDSSGTVNAQYNWWGSASGPSGSDISGNVDYSNWWDAPNQDLNGVWNVMAIRRGSSMIVDLYYDLVGIQGTTYLVDVAVSSTGGEPYTITPDPSSFAVDSDVGAGISPGEGLHIVWDAAANGGGGYTDQMRVKVTADLE